MPDLCGSSVGLFDLEAGEPALEEEGERAVYLSPRFGDGRRGALISVLRICGCWRRARMIVSASGLPVESPKRWMTLRSA